MKYMFVLYCLATVYCSTIVELADMNQGLFPKKEKKKIVLMSTLEEIISKSHIKRDA